MSSAPNPTSHELDAPPWLRVDSTLMASARRLREAYDLRLAALGLTLSQASLLAYVIERGPTTQTRIAAQLELGRAATGSTVDQLERRGVVERRPDPDDRRVWIVAPTPSGIELGEQIAGVDRALRQELRDGISREERQLLATLINRLRANADRAIDRTPTNPSADRK
jgi:DNA-binding MarR family transcriptional regulator